MNFPELHMVKVFYDEDQTVPAVSIFVLNAMLCQAWRDFLEMLLL